MRDLLSSKADQCLFAFIEGHSELADRRHGIRHIIRQGGQLVYEQGEPAHGCYWLCRGQIKLARRNRRGRAQFIRFVRPGQLFGVEALLEQADYDQYAQAGEESEITLLEGRDVLMALLDKPSFAALAVTSLASEVFEVEGRLKVLLAGGARERVVHALLMVAKSEHTVSDRKLHLTNEVLASLIGSSPQTVSKCLSRLKLRGLIAHQRGRITILEPTKLRTLL